MGALDAHDDGRDGDDGGDDDDDAKLHTFSMSLML